MKSSKIAYCLLFSFLFSGIAIAQNSASAEKMYQDLAYKEVIKLYEEKDKLGIEEMERIANGYRLNHNTENAALWYSEVVKESYNPINFLYYAQALQSNGDYEKAKKYYLRYNELLGAGAADQRGVYLAAAIDRMNDWNNEEAVVLKREDAINSENLDFSPTFYKDGIVFVSSRKLTDNKKYKWNDEYFMNLYYAASNKEGELESVESFSKMINSKYHEGPVAFDKSFSRIFFTRNDHLNGKIKKSKKGVMKLGIFTALRDGESWGEPKALEFNTVESEECHPTLSADGRFLYFASDRDGGQGGMDIYVAEFNAGKWGDPKNLGPSINTAGNEVFPFIHDDGTLYFASDGWGGMGGLDIFHSKKEASNSWTTSTNMGQPYNSRKDDFGFVLNVLGTEGYLNSSREGGKGKDDIYSFQRGSFDETNSEHTKPFTPQNKDGNSGITVYQLINNHYSEVVLDEKAAMKMLADNKDENGKDKKIIVLIDEEEIDAAVNETQVDEIITMPESVEPEFKPEPTPRPTPKPTPKKKTVIKSKKALPSFNMMVKKKRFSVGERYVLKNLYYEFDKKDITKKGAKELDRLIKFMNDNPNMKIELSAHTDSRGRERYNKWLSRKRAEAALQYLTDHGIASGRIIAKGYGETKLRNNCKDGVECEEKYHQRNRRTEIKVLKI